MARRAGLRAHSSRALPLAFAALVALALLPARLTDPAARRLGVIATVLVGPVSHPVHWLVVRLGAGPGGPAESDPAAGQLRAELEQLKAAYLRALADKERLETHLYEVQRAGSPTPDLPVRLLRAPVIARSGNIASSALEVRAGTRDGVEPNAVAVVRGTQLVGRVLEGVQRRTCTVLPITDRQARALQGVIMLDDLTPGPRCLLAPADGEGLVGDIEWPPGSVSQPDVRPGLPVRLLDDVWPRHAQGLLIGTVAEVRPGASPGRQRAVVRPTVPVGHVTEVVLRFTPDEDASGDPP
ncbi:MAG TPA: rod shape-determining protein MreC [Phycisphaerales bacterium]|nr:rod shape-determining protein MreC [Phycisphaerales bacterium]